MFDERGEERSESGLFVEGSADVEGVVAAVEEPVGVVLETTGIGETVLVTPDTDPASAFGVGALWTQRTLDTGVGEGWFSRPCWRPVEW